MSSSSFPQRSTSTELPALRSLIMDYAPSVRRGRLVLITHILPTSRSYVELLSTVFDVFLIGIPYSCCSSTVESLRADGYRVIVPNSIEDIARTTLRVVSELSKTGRPLVVQEVGGYLAAFAERLNGFENFCGVVEDTNNGHWRYEKTDQRIEFPVLSIARSPIKAIEDSQIGDAVVHSVERIMREQLHRVIKGVNALVIGFGKIGSSCVEALRRRGLHTAVFDVDPVKLVHARSCGYKVTSLHALLADADIVIGATGHCCLTSDALGFLKDGAVLASASSRQIEFDIEFLKKSFHQERVAPNVVRYFNTERWHFYLLSEGHPVNFRDYSVLGDVLDAVYSELFLCVREIFERRAPIGLSDSSASLHNEVAQAWCDCHLTLTGQQTGSAAGRLFSSRVANAVIDREQGNRADERIRTIRHYRPRGKSKIANRAHSACKVKKEVKHA